MAKRKLSTQQKRRIQSRRANDHKLNDQTLNEDTLGPRQEGLVVANFGRHTEIEDQHQQVHTCMLRQNLPTLVTGDKVIWQATTAHHGIIVSDLPRTTLLYRTDARDQIKPIAANINRLFVVIAPEPSHTLQLIDRYLVASEYFHIKPVLVFNKSDLLTEHERSVVRKDLAIYQQLGYELLFVSCESDDGLTALETALMGNMSVFFGQSGVGKSSLINALLASTDVKVGDISTKSKKGRHTTTTARLYHLLKGGILIDSPGIRDFSLQFVKAQDLAEGFIEFRPFLSHCKFRDCRHLQEVDCAILNAVKQGLISPSRYQNYKRILEKGICT